MSDLMIRPEVQESRERRWNPAQLLNVPQQAVKFILTAIFLLALTLRIIYIVVGTPELTFDEPYYDHIASQLVMGNGFTFAFSAWNTSIPNQPTSVQEPVYPLFLALLKILFGSENYQAARFVQAFVGAMITVVGGALGARLFGWGVGILSAVVLAIYPPLIYFGRFLMTETLYTFFLVAAVYMLVRQEERSSQITSFLGGLAFGLASLTRSIAFIFAPAYLLWVWITGIKSRDKLMVSVFTLLGICSVMVPWIWRNYSVHHTLIPLATKGGWNLYFYNYPVANYDFNNRWDDIPVPDLRGLTEAERNKEFSSLGVSFIRENPRLIASFAFAKFVDFWNPMLKNDIKVLSYINFLFYGGCTLLAFIGLFGNMIHHNFKAATIFIWALIGFYALQAMIFTGGGKARLPIEPFLVVLACETIWKATVRVRTRIAWRPVGFHLPRILRLRRM